MIQAFKSYWGSSPGKDKMDYLTTITSDGNLKLEWDMICEKVRKLHYESFQPFGILSVIGGRSSGKTTLVESIIQEGRHEAKPVNDAVCQKSQPQAGVSLRFEPILLPEDGFMKALYCLDIINKGQDSHTDAKLLQFCMRVSSTLIIIFDDDMDVTWMTTNLKASLSEGYDLPLSRNLILVHKSLLTHQNGDFKLLPCCRHSMDEFLKHCDAKSDLLEKQISVFSNFAETLTTYFVASSSYVFFPEDFLKFLQESASDKDFYATVFSNGCVFSEDGILAHQDRMGNYLKTSVDALLPYHKRDSKGDKALGPLSESDFLQICETVRDAFDEVSKRERKKLFGSSLFIPKSKLRKFTEHLQAKVLEEVKKLLPAHTKDYNPVILHMVEEKVKVYFQGYHQSIKNHKSIKTAFRKAALDYLLQYMLAAAARGDKLGEWMQKLPKLEEYLLMESKELDEFAKLKDEMEIKTNQFKIAVTKAHNILCDFDNRLKAMLRGSKCVTPGTIAALRYEVKKDAKNIEFKCSDDELEMSLANLVGSVKEMLLSRFESVNNSNHRFEIVLAKRAKEICLEKYKSCMSISLDNSCYSFPDFNRRHEELKDATIKSFRPATTTEKFIASFVWTEESAKLSQSLDKLRNDFQKCNDQNWAKFNSNRNKFIEKSLQFFVNELQKSRESNVNRRIFAAKRAAYEFFHDSAKTQKEEHVKLWVQELSAAIEKEAEQYRNGSSTIMAGVDSIDSPTSTQSQCEDIPKSFCTEIPPAFTRSKDNGIQLESSSLSYGVSINGNGTTRPLKSSSPLQEAEPGPQDHHSTTSGGSANEKYQISYSDSPLKSDIADLIKEIKDKLRSSSNAESSKKYIKKQIQDAQALLQNPKARTSHLMQAKGVLEIAIETI